MTETVRVGIVGASGYVGGEALRLLLDHPHTEVTQVTSERNAGKFVHLTHPNLRGRTKLQFTSAGRLEDADVLFLCLPHGHAQKRIEEFTGKAERIVDLSADFRLRDPAAYAKWYGETHDAPAWLDRFVYGLPETRREQLKGAKLVSGVGCNATATNLALKALVQAEVLDTDKPVCVDLKVGSSEGGNKFSLASHHPERAGVVRTFSPTNHRHTAEVEQELGLSNVHLTVTSLPIVRGVVATAHAWVKPGVTEKDLWKAYRPCFKAEPFVRIVRDKTGIHRLPEPKILAGSNYADVGFSIDAASGRVVSLCALDNLMKGAAGSALQCLNLMMGWDETLGLRFPVFTPARERAMFVVKVGGAENVDYDAVCTDLAALATEGKQWVLVHGGSHETNVVAEQLGHPPKFVTSVSGYTSRRTDRRTLEIFQMVYCGKTNKGIVERLQAQGVNAVGLSGMDGRLLEGKRKKAIKIVDADTGKRMVVRDDFSGTITKVNADLIRLLTDNGYAPVITPPAISEESQGINVDGDRAAARIAAALEADTLIILSDIPGVLKDFPDPQSLLKALPRDQIEMAQEKYAAGRMKIKLLGAKEALEGGVKRVVIGNSQGEAPVRAALEGAGTVIS